MHIPKVAGSSIIMEVKSSGAIPHFYPDSPAGQEHCLQWDREQRPGWDSFTFLRSPRAHVWSQYTECRYDEWGRRTTEGTGFPRSGTTLQGFTIWVQHFAASPRTRENFGCYQPQNMQARHIVGSAPSNRCHNVLEHDPSLDQAMLYVQTQLKFVGSVDFYHESNCLMYSLISGARAKRRFRELSCACSADGRTALNEPVGLIHRTHHSQGHRDNYDFEPSLLAKVDALTVIDRQVYAFGLQKFMCQMRALEAYLGYRVLCDNTLASKQASLMYVANVSALYYQSSCDIFHCESWCASHQESWSVKCAWAAGTCSGCIECPRPHCESWCASHQESWSVKCAWAAGTCSGCLVCSSMR